MPRTRLVVAAAAAVALIMGFPALAAETTGQINLFTGQRALDNDFEPAEDALQLGFMLSIGRPEWPVQLAADLMFASEDDAQAFTLDGFPVTGDVDVEITELDLGIRQFIGEGPFRLYYGGGAALLKVDFDSTIRDGVGPLFTAADDDEDLGLWLNVGGSWQFAERFQAGVDIRYTDAEVNFLDDGQSFDAGGLQYGVTVGYRW